VSKNEAVGREIQTYCGSSPLARFKKNAGHIFTIYKTKNEAVGHEVPARFVEEVLGALSQFMHPKIKLFAVKF